MVLNPGKVVMGREAVWVPHAAVPEMIQWRHWGLLPWQHTRLGTQMSLLQARLLGSSKGYEVARPPYEVARPPSFVRRGTRSPLPDRN